MRMVFCTLCRFVRDHELTCSTLSRFSELTGRLAAVKKGAERAEARAFVDSLADILLPNMHTCVRCLGCALTWAHSVTCAGWLHLSLTCAGVCLTAVHKTLLSAVRSA